MDRNVTRDSASKRYYIKRKKLLIRFKLLFSLRRNVTLLKKILLITGLKGNSRNTFTLCRCRDIGLERGIGRGLARERR
jgi:hypothetical protein